tara:strand:- start:45601 stop:46200 length:600 start_codon:yes stop_codon:yes gene_type:complete
MKFNYPIGATPLTKDELEDLIPAYIRTQSDLNTAEQMNISKAKLTIGKKKYSFDSVLDDLLIRKLHKLMFGDVWQWAGKYRKSDKNIGVDWRYINVELKQLLDNTKFQIDKNSYSEFEIAIRFHHKFVWIHPFPNGNGRLARILTDMLLATISNQKFTWGGSNIYDYKIASKIREQYIKALRKADKGEYNQLMKFATAI